MRFQTLKKMLMEINPPLAELELTAYLIQKYVENEPINLNDQLINIYMKKAIITLVEKHGFKANFSGIGLDFKTLYLMNTDNTAKTTISGSNYSQVLKNLINYFYKYESR